MNQKKAIVSRVMIIDWITDIWNNSIINKDLIYNSFRVCRLSNQLSWNENYLFKRFNLLWQKIANDDKDVNGKIVEDIIDEMNNIIIH